jgi:Flp pilus assembly protein TadG
MRARFPTRAWRRLRGDQRGVAAIEFALVVPVVIVIYLVGFEVTEAATAYRKLTDTTVQLANVTSQFTSMSSTDVPNVLDATVQIMTPYPTSSISIVLSEVTTNSAGAGTVTWSQEYQGTCLAVGTPITMPAGFQTPNSSYVMVQTSYSYQPTIGAAFIGPGRALGPITMQDKIFMLPRASSSIPAPNCTA